MTAAFVVLGLVVAALIGALVYVVRVMREAYRDADAAHRTLVEVNKSLSTTQADLIAMRANRDHVLEMLQVKTDELGRAQAARKKVEADRDELLKTLADHGDPGAIVDRINDELRKLSDLSSAATPPGRDR